MLIGFEGGLGDGKTILLTKYLMDEHYHNKRPIMSNFNLTKIPYKKLDVLELLENKAELYNVCVGIDEITVYVDCRMSSSRANRFFSYLVLQSRKRDVDIYYTSQSLGMLDFRVVNHTPITVLCKKMYDKQNKEIKDYRYYTIFDLRNIRHISAKHFIMYIKPYYDCYDTNEIIDPLWNVRNKDTFFKNYGNKQIKELEKK
jgi:hypothetical protein